MQSSSSFAGSQRVTHLDRDLVKLIGMSDFKCPFSVVQAAGVCQCRHAQQVVRRGGSEFDCKEPDAQAACDSLTNHLYAIALPALGYTDDLTQTPKSVYERILIGGLQGLRIALNQEDLGVETKDIWIVVESCLAKYKSMTDIPVTDFLPIIKETKHRKRSRRKD